MVLYSVYDKRQGLERRHALTFYKLHTWSYSQSNCVACAIGKQSRKQKNVTGSEGNHLGDSGKRK